MKIKKGVVTSIRMFVVVSLLLLKPYRGTAETDYTKLQANETARRMELKLNVTDTPEKLLTIIREVLIEQDVNGYDFGEKITGVNRVNWGSKSIHKGFGKNENIIWAGYTVGEFTQPPVIPYQFSGIKLDGDDRLLDVILFFKNQEFRLTPDMTQKILGQPTRIDVTWPFDEFSYGKYRVNYFYTKENYNLLLVYSSPDERNPEVLEEQLKHDFEKARKERECRQSFENHKDFLLVSIRLSRNLQ